MILLLYQIFDATLLKLRNRRAKEIDVIKGIHGASKDFIFKSEKEV